jgi:O-antigen biosynthesis protein
VRCIQAILYWCYDSELYSTVQSTRSWAYGGSEHVTLRFTIPPLLRKIVGLRLIIQPYPIGASIKALHYFGAGKATKWYEEDVQIKSFAEANSRISSYAEPAYAESQDVCAVIQAKQSILDTLSKGGTIDLVLSLAFQNQSNHDTKDNNEFLPALGISQTNENTKHTPAVAKELQELHNEVKVMDATIRELYRSKTWQSTHWCRDLMAAFRKSILWSILVFFEKKFRQIIHKPLKSPVYLSGSQPVDIIIPVYDGIDYAKVCLDSVLSSTYTVDHEIIVVDDASPDPKVTSWLDKLAGSKHITLLRNQTNLGFTGAINRGMSLHPDRDIVLLNSDTAVYNNWLDRLQRAAYTKDMIGTVTPFTNNGSICSYPRTGQECDLPFGFEPQALDNLFSGMNNRNLVEIPTAVGFCMYIKRECINNVGEFDANTFPGYGEENDFCMRASKLGWLHVLATDTFVFHKGSASYSGSSKRKKRTAYDALEKVHPEYQSIVNEFARIDPIQHFRQNIDLERLKTGKKPIVLMILHGLAGGTEKHVFELAKYFNEQIDFLSLRIIGEHAEIRWMNEGEGFFRQFEMPSAYSSLKELLKSLPIQRIHIHHFLGLESYIEKLVSDLDLPFDFTAHDYYTVCPRGWLCDHRQHYCGEPDADRCNACIALLAEPKMTSIQNWRKNHAWIIDKAQRVFIPSNDCLTRLSKYLPARDYILAKHLDNTFDDNLQPQPINILPTEPLRIAVLGLLNAEKGADILDECAHDACDRKLPLEFHFMGAAHRSLSSRPQSSLIMYGRYVDSELQDLLKQVRPHLVWFPAQCPETYSYTLSACLEAGLPVVAPDLGAFPERLAGRNWSWIVPWQQEACKRNDFFLKIMNEHFLLGVAPSPPAGEAFSGNFSYQRDYLKPIMANYAAAELQPA